LYHNVISIRLMRPKTSLKSSVSTEIPLVPLQGQRLAQTGEFIAETTL